MTDDQFTQLCAMLEAIHGLLREVVTENQTASAQLASAKPAGPYEGLSTAKGLNRSSRGRGWDDLSESMH